MNDSILVTSEVLAVTKFRAALSISGALLSVCHPAFHAHSRNQQSQETQSAGVSQKLSHGKTRSTLLKRIPNNFLQMLLPDVQPFMLIVHVVMKVVSGHNPTHLMSEQLFYYVWRRAVLTGAWPPFASGHAMTIPSSILAHYLH
jgi:hypothetical protein